MVGFFFNWLFKNSALHGAETHVCTAFSLDFTFLFQGPTDVQLHYNYYVIVILFL